MKLSPLNCIKRGLHSGSWFPSSAGSIDHHHGWPGQSLVCSCTGQILSRHAGGATGATRLGQDMSGAGGQILAGQVGDLIQVCSSGKSKGNKQMTRQRRGQLKAAEKLPKAGALTWQPLPTFTKLGLLSLFGWIIITACIQQS